MLTLTNVALSAAGALVFWMSLSAFYNLYLHPLARFAGPKWAGATSWWKFYVECIRHESLCIKLQELHKRYGDVVRISPNELHFAKPSAYHEIYNPRNRWSKDLFLYRVFAEVESLTTLVHYDEAKKRRDITLPLFSRASILKMQDLIQDCVNTMCEKMAAYDAVGKSIDIRHAFRSAALDTICSFCFAKSAGALDAPDFKSPIQVSMSTALPMVHWFKHLPLLQKMLNQLPPFLVVLLDPAMKGYVDIKEMFAAQVSEVIKNPESLQNAPHPIIYHEFLKMRGDGYVPPSEMVLRDEAMLLINAGVDTVSDALTVGTLNVLHNPRIHKRLQQELLEAWPVLDQSPRYEALERIPYLRAIIKESLRMSHGVVHPMLRIVPSSGAMIAGHYIPAGTVVGSSNIFVHWNDEIFPDPYTFDPERWLAESHLENSLDHWLVSFGKGPRACLGINLAYCELYITFAHLFRRHNLVLDGVGPADWKWSDCYLPHYEGPESLCVRASPCAS